MDRVIEVKVGGNYLCKDNKNAGVKGEANVTILRITFDEGWDNYAKKVTFWDALGGNPVGRTLTVDLLEDAANNTRVYLVPIPKEPMAEIGKLTFVIDGYQDGKRQRTLSDTLEVKYAPAAEDAGEPTDPTPTQAEQLQAEIDAIKDTISEAISASIVSAEAAERAREEAESASEEAGYAHQEKVCAQEYADASIQASLEALRAAERAERASGKTSYIGDNGNWYAWDSSLNEFYDTGVRAQAGSTVYYGDNPPEEADVWIDPNGETIYAVKSERDLIDSSSIRLYGVKNNQDVFEAPRSNTSLSEADANAGINNTTYDRFLDKDVYIYQSTIMRRDGNGRCSILAPIYPKHIANKEYVDSIAGDIETALDRIIAIQNGLIGGGTV